MKLHLTFHVRRVLSALLYIVNIASSSLQIYKSNSTDSLETNIFNIGKKVKKSLK